MSIVDTYTVTVYMAGDIDTAKRWLRAECYREGLCVTVTPTTFIYTGGEETGFAIGFVNYPRFAHERGSRYERARSVASSLVAECCQKTALIVATDRTELIQIAPPGVTQ